eukprot:m.118219 g.118219  ORF g.118219 m.118219 type:complete len:406 (-) comp13224_c0_seq5:138-1355(-)
MSDLYAAATRGNIADVVKLLGQGADPLWSNQWQTTALHAAATKGHAGIVRALISAGAVVDARNVASYSGMKEVVEVLVLADADTDAKNNKGKTVMDYAREQGHGERIEFVLQQALQKKGLKVTATKASGGADPPVTGMGSLTIGPPPAAGVSLQPTAPATALGVAETGGRFHDFEHVAGEFSPIRGVFDLKTNPVTSMKDALARTGLDLSGELYMAHRWAAKSPGLDVIAGITDMTVDEGVALRLYTCESPLYGQLNSVLRSSDRNELKARFFPYLRLLLGGLAKIGAQEKRMVNRGVKLDLVTVHPAAYAPGKTLIWWALTSTTAKISALCNPMFLGSNGDRTIFQIMTSGAVDVSPFSAVQGEAELILPPGTALRITDILPKDASGLTIVVCEDDPTVPALIS